MDVPVTLERKCFYLASFAVQMAGAERSRQAANSDRAWRSRSTAYQTPELRSRARTLERAIFLHAAPKPAAKQAGDSRVATATQEGKQPKALPPPNSDFYEL